jgi:hypothetical protein
MNTNLSKFSLIFFYNDSLRVQFHQESHAIKEIFFLQVIKDRIVFYLKKEIE